MESKVDPIHAEMAGVDDDEYPDCMSVKQAAERAAPINLSTCFGVNSGPNQSPMQQYPILGEITLSHGQRAPSPYHNYGAHVNVIFGSADMEFCNSVIKGPWLPMPDKDGKALTTVWVVDYRDTCLGPYKELIIGIGCVHETKRYILDKGPFTAFDLLRFMDDEVANPYVYKMWLGGRSAKNGVDYGREVCGVDKYHDPEAVVDFKINPGCCGPYDGAPDECTTEWKHAADERNADTHGASAGDFLIKGTVRLQKALVNLGPLFSLIGAMGLCRALGLLPRLLTGEGMISDWQAIFPPGIMSEGPGRTHNPCCGFKIVTNPRFTVATPDNQYEYGGELKRMNFGAHVYMYDSNFTFVLMAPHTYINVE